MQAEAQGWKPAGHQSGRGRVTIALLLAGATCGLSACGGGVLAKAEADPTILTSSVAKSSDPVLAQDQVTIRNVVTAIDAEEMGSRPLPWANTATGSRGTVTALSEYADGPSLCRRYTATRESYDGVNLFRGETCYAPNGGWLSRSFTVAE